MYHTGTGSDDDDDVEFEEEELVVLVGWQGVEDRVRM